MHFVTRFNMCVFGCRGLHFLALQKDEEAEQCAGVWLLQDREPPSI